MKELTPCEECNYMRNQGLTVRLGRELEDRCSIRLSYGRTISLREGLQALLISGMRQMTTAPRATVPAAMRKQPAVKRIVIMAAPQRKRLSKPSGRLPFCHKLASNLIMVKDVCSHFLMHQLGRPKAEEISARWFEDCRRVLDCFARFVGPARDPRRGGLAGRLRQITVYTLGSHRILECFHTGWYTTCAEPLGVLGAAGAAPAPAE